MTHSYILNAQPTVTQNASSAWEQQCRSTSFFNSLAHANTYAHKHTHSWRIVFTGKTTGLGSQKPYRSTPHSHNIQVKDCSEESLGPSSEPVSLAQNFHFKLTAIQFPLQSQNMLITETDVKHTASSATFSCVCPHHDARDAAHCFGALHTQSRRCFVLAAAVLVSDFPVWKLTAKEKKGWRNQLSLSAVHFCCRNIAGILLHIKQHHLGISVRKRATQTRIIK